MNVLLLLAAVGCLMVLAVPGPPWIRRHWRMALVVLLEMAALLAYRAANGLP